MKLTIRGREAEPSGVGKEFLGVLRGQNGQFPQDAAPVVLTTSLLLAKAKKFREREKAAAVQAKLFENHAATLANNGTMPAYTSAAALTISARFTCPRTQSSTISFFFPLNHSIHT